MTKEDLREINLEIFNILNTSDYWYIEWDENLRMSRIIFQDVEYLVEVDEDTPEELPVLSVMVPFHYDLNFDQSLEQINAFNLKFGAAKVAINKENKCLVFMVSTGIEIVPDEMTCAYVEWAITYLNNVGRKSINEGIIDCLKQ